MILNCIQVCHMLISMQMLWWNSVFLKPSINLLQEIRLLSGLKGAGSLITANPVPMMQFLVDSEMKLLKGMNVQGIFLLNIVTDLLLGLEMHDMLYEFSQYTEKKYNVKAGFFTMNHVKLHDVLVNKLGINDPIIVSDINKIGFRMNPSQKEVENTLKKKDSYNIAMSFLASGAINLKKPLIILCS